MQRLVSTTERREWDSNPRWVAPHTLSKRADSAALAPLLGTRARGSRAAGQGIVAVRSPWSVAVGSCATAAREPSQGRKAAALSGARRVPQIAWPPRSSGGAGAPAREPSTVDEPRRRTPMAYQSLYRRYRPQRFAEVGARTTSSPPCATPCADGPGRPRLPLQRAPGHGQDLDRPHPGQGRSTARTPATASRAASAPSCVADRGGHLLRRARARRRLQQRRRRHARPHRRRRARHARARTRSTSSTRSTCSRRGRRTPC